jgi:hypothetical protein
MIAEEELNEIEQRANKAQNSPWKAFIEGRNHESGSDFIMIGLAENRKDDIELIGATADDYDFIANARQDIPKLINEIRELKNKIK